MSKKQLPEYNGTQKDGFDFIEYPCDYLFKAMCKANLDMQSQLRQLVLQHIEPKNLLVVRSNQSRTAKFESITLKVRLFDRTELENIYRAISSCPNVLMTL